MPIDDDQLVEVAELGGPDTRPLRAAIAIHEISMSHLGQIRLVADAFRHQVVASGAGNDGVDRVLAALRDTPPQVVVVGVPGGEAVVDAARALEPRRPVTVITGPGSVDELAERAVNLGADLYTVRPHELDRIGPVLAAAARLAEVRAELVAARGAHQLLRHRVDDLVHREVETGLHSFEMFQQVLELELKRSKRYGYPLSVGLLELSGELPPGGERIVRARATAAITGAIRDIDLLTELDDGRFLVLLPYTDLRGAAQVGHRMIQAIGELPQVTIGGVSATPKLRVGVAGAHGGQPLSFARLMRDASAALAQARDDDAELVVST